MTSMTSIDAASQASSPAAPSRAARVPGGAPLRYDTVHAYGMWGPAVQFAISLMRCRGRTLPREELANRAPYVGDLRIDEVHDATLLRHLRTARVLAPDGSAAPHVLCELLEPAMIAMSPQAFTLSGFERVGEQCYAQSWLVRWPDQANASVGGGPGFRPVTRMSVPGRG